MSDESETTPEQKEARLDSDRQQFISLVRKAGYDTAVYREGLRGDCAALEAKSRDAERRFPVWTQEDFALVAFVEKATPIGLQKGREFWLFPSGQVFSLATRSDDLPLIAKAMISPGTFVLSTAAHDRPESRSGPAPDRDEHSRSREQARRNEKEALCSAVDSMISKASQNSFVVKRKGDTLAFRSVRYPEIIGEAPLNLGAALNFEAEDAKAAEVARQVEAALHRQTAAFSEFEARLSGMRRDIGLVRTEEKGGTVRYHVPGIAGCSVVMDKHGTGIEAVTKKLNGLAMKIEQANNQREQKKQRLVQKGFAVEELPASEACDGGQGRMLRISHPNPEFEQGGTITAPLIAGRLISDDANQLLNRADRFQPEKTQPKPALAATVTHGHNGHGGSHAERVHKTTAVKTSNGVTVKDRSNIISRQIPASLLEPHRNGGISNGAHQAEPRAPEKVDIIIDTNVLSLLSGVRSIDTSRRGKDMTWLDLLPVLASLPNVNLVFPSYIADFEFAGIIPHNGDTKRIDLDQDRLKYNFHRSFFSRAQRNNGKGHEEEAYLMLRHPNVHIWESPEQNDLYGKLQHFLAGLTPRTDAYNERIRAFRNYHHDKGEDLAYAYSQSPESCHPVIMVTNDGRFAGRFNGGCYNPLKMTNACGRGISVCSGRDFIDAVNKAFNGNLAAELGGNPKNTGYDAIVRNYNATHAHHNEENRSVFSYMRGKAETGADEGLLEDVLKAGVAARKSGPGLSPAYGHAGAGVRHLNLASDLRAPER